MEEVWRDVFGYEGLYQVSNYGRVKSLTRRINSGLNYSHYKTVYEQILKPSKDKDGYACYVLWKENRNKKWFAHKLVSITFIPNPDNLPCVNHKDENKLNNFVWVNPDGSIDESKSNLEWCTVKYNTNYGTAIQRRSEKTRNGKLSKPVLQFSMDGTFIKEWESVSDTRRAGLSSVDKCCNGKRKSAHGFIWKYKKEGD